MTAELHPQPTFALWESILDTGSFEEVYETLATVVAQLEEARLSLEDSLACYELGVRLAARCEQFLDEAELRISRLDELSPGSGDTEESEFDNDDDMIPF